MRLDDNGKLSAGLILSSHLDKSDSSRNREDENCTYIAFHDEATCVPMEVVSSLWLKCPSVT